jgi:hypothetical protein
VFALASAEGCVTVVAGQGERVQPNRKGAYKADFQVKGYTSFDAKASKATFRPTRGDEVFSKLLLRSRVFPKVYWTRFVDGV